jgi:hypothetical protein
MIDNNLQEIVISKFRSMEEFLNEMEKIFLDDNIAAATALNKLAMWYGKLSSDFRDIEKFFEIYSSNKEYSKNMINNFIDFFKKGKNVKR